MMLTRTILLVAIGVAMAVGAYVATQALADADTAPVAPRVAAFDWLGLSSDQQAAIQANDPGFEPEAAKLRAVLQTEREKLAALFEQPDTTDRQILDQIERVRAAEHALETRVVKYLLAVRQHLSPEQQKRLMGLAAQGLRDGRGRQFRGGRGSDGPVDIEPGGGRRGFGPGGGGGGPGGGGRRQGRPAETAPATQSSLNHHETIMALFAAHKAVERRVEAIDGGIRSTTTSTQPETVRLLQQHVRDMKSRLESGHPIRRGDPLFRAIFEHRKKIVLEWKELENGVVVTETSDDPEVAALIRAHAEAVTEFVREGESRMYRPTTLPAKAGLR